MRDDLKHKAQELADRQGVSLNNYINATLAASVAQEETLRIFDERLRNVDTDALRNRVMRFMKKTKPGKEPTPERIRRAIGGE